MTQYRTRNVSNEVQYHPNKAANTTFSNIFIDHGDVPGTELPLRRGSIQNVRSRYNGFLKLSNTSSDSNS